MTKNKTEKTKTEKVELEAGRNAQLIDYTKLSRDATNQRRTYPADSIQELGESILEQGVMQNLECDPAGVVHMGNRRHLATEQVVVPYLEGRIELIGSHEWPPEWRELNGIPDPEAELERCKARLEELRLMPVRVLTWEQATRAKERQIVENLQREDVSAVDEAEGYAALLEARDEAGEPRYTVDSIAQRIGKGRTCQYVRNRLKLRLAPERLLIALAAGDVSIRVCEMVGRIPNGETREELAGRVINPRYGVAMMAEKEVAELIRAEYMLPLVATPFDQADVSLVPGAGACATCEFRSGNDQSLAGGFRVASPGKNTSGIAPNLCTNPACFRQKADAAWGIQASKWLSEGCAIMPDEEAKKAFNYTGELVWKSPWIDLAAKPSHDDLGTFETKGLPTWKALLKDEELKITKARNPHKPKVHDLVSQKVAREAVKLMLERLKVDPEPVKDEKMSVVIGLLDKRDREETDRKADAAKQREEDKIKKLVAIGVVDELLDAMTAGDEVHLAREVLLAVLEMTLDGSADACAFFAYWSDLEKPHAGASGRDYLPTIMDRVRNRNPAYSDRDLCALIALSTIAAGVKWQGANSQDLRKLASAVGMDLVAVEKAVRKKVKDEERAKKPVKSGKGAPAGEEGIKPEAGLEADVKLIRARCAAEPSFQSLIYPEIAKLLGWTKKRVLAAYNAIDAEDLAATPRKPTYEEMTLLGPDNGNAPLNERRLIKMEEKLWGDIAPPAKIDHGWLISNGATQAEHGTRLWAELQARGIVDEDGIVAKRPLGWRHDAVGNRRANDYYEARVEAGEAVSIAEVQVRFGLKDKALATYRKNQNRGGKGKGGAEG